MKLKNISLLTVIIILSISYPAQSKKWRIHASFDEGVIGARADNGGDGFHGAGGHSVYTNEQAIKGNAAKLKINKGSEGWGTWGGYFLFPKTYRGETIWLLIHTYMPTEFEHYAYSAGNRLKFLRIHTATSLGKHIGFNDFLFDMKNSPSPFKYIYEGEDKWSNIGVYKNSPKKDTWESYEIAITLDCMSVDDGGLACIKIWKNGSLLKKITNRITLKFNDAYADMAYIFTYWNGGSPKNQYMYVDEITITNTQPDKLDKHGNYFLKGLIVNH